MDTPEMIWGRALAVHRPEIDFCDADEHAQEKKLSPIWSFFATILMIGPIVLEIVLL